MLMRKNVSGLVPRSYSGSIVPLHDSGEGSNGHTVRRVLLCVDPNSFSTLALSFSSPLARRENYTPDDWDLYHVLLGFITFKHFPFNLPK
jgi:hypothetical protein